MRLFNRLLQFQTDINQSEDYFTEIVASVLRQKEGLLFAWLPQLGFENVEQYDSFEIKTQSSFAEGRPDILIELETRKGAHEWILIESKLGSPEGNNQLRNYASLLARQKRLKKRTLLFITRDFDPKSQTTILKDLPKGSVEFRQYRWYHFYQFLQPYRDESLLIDEVCAFMEEIKMAHKNQFSPTDILALSNLPHIFSLMNESLFGEVNEQMIEVFGKASTRARARAELPNQRYIIYSYPHRSKSYWVGVGYFFDETAYPKCGMVVGHSKNRGYEDEILSVFREVSQLDGWQGEGVNRPRARLYCKRPLNHFLEADDHIQAVKDYFIELIEQWRAIQVQYPQLPIGYDPDDSVEEDTDDGSSTED